MVHIGALEYVAEDLALELVAVAAEPFAVSRSVLGTDASGNFYGDSGRCGWWYYRYRGGK